MVGNVVLRTAHMGLRMDLRTRTCIGPGGVPQLYADLHHHSHLVGWNDMRPVRGELLLRRASR
jgi:hypothetical protein